MCSPITVPGHLLGLPLPLLAVEIQNCGCLEQCVDLQALRCKVTVTQFLKWLNGKVQLGLLGSTSCLGVCLSKERASPGPSLPEHLSFGAMTVGPGTDGDGKSSSLHHVKGVLPHKSYRIVPSLQVRIFHL